MPDYRCPSCRGGFPAAAVATDDACPWCGESMDGSDGGPITPSATAAIRQGSAYSPLEPTEPHPGPLNTTPLDERDVLGDRFQRDVGDKETARERMHRIADAFDSGDH